jgi:DNA-binding transcriptional ArsR family regulator
MLTPMNQVDSVFAALSDRTRRGILECVREKPRSVSDIAGRFSVTRPAVSQHLRILQDAGLVRSQRSGRENYYGLEMSGLVVAREYIEGFWADVLAAFQAAAVQEADLRRRKR